MKKFDISTAFFATIGLILAIIDFEKQMYSLNEKLKGSDVDYLYEMGEGRAINEKNFFIMCVLSLSTILALCSLFIRYFYKVKWLNAYKKYQEIT